MPHRAEAVVADAAHAVGRGGARQRLGAARRVARLDDQVHVAQAARPSRRSRTGPPDQVARRRPRRSASRAPLRSSGATRRPGSRGARRPTRLRLTASRGVPAPRGWCALDGLAQPRPAHVGVDLRGREVGVAEHRLHRAQVGAAFEQVGREGVAQHVRRDALARDPRAARQLAQPREEVLPRHRRRRARSGRPRRAAAPSAAPRAAGPPRARPRAPRAPARRAGTMRSRPPLPSTRSSPARRSSAASGSETSSETRSPAP